MYSIGIGLAGAWTGAAIPVHAETAAPTITSFAPTSAVAGGPAFTLTVAGTNFITTSKVYFGTKLVPTTFASATKLTAAIPADAIATAGNVSFAVTNGEGLGHSDLKTFVVVPAVKAPVLSSLDPATVVAGHAAFTLKLTGANFTANSKVSFGTAAVPTTFVSATQLTAAISADAVAKAGSIAVSVSNGEGAGHSESKTFVVTAPITPPSISSLDPGTAVAGGPAFTLNVNGANFIADSKVYFGTALVPTTYVSATKLTAAIPASAIAAAGNIAVVVTNGEGKGHSDAKTFVVTSAVTSAPVITSLDPTTKVAGGPAFTLTITGKNFLATSTVAFGSKLPVTTFVSSTQLKAAITADMIAAAGNVGVIVNNGEGKGHSDPASFTITTPVVIAPTIGSLNPATVQAGSPGFTLTVSGTGFIAASKVYFGTTLLSTTYVSPTQLMVLVPAVAVANAGHIGVVVTNGDGNGHSAAFDFPVTAAVVAASPRVTYYVNTVPGADGIGVSYPIASDTALDLTLPVSVSVVIPASTEPGGNTAAITVYQSDAVTLTARTQTVNGVSVTVYVFENTKLRIGVLPHDGNQYSVEQAAKGLDLSAINRTRPVVVTLTIGGKTFTGKAVPTTRPY